VTRFLTVMWILWAVVFFVAAVIVFGPLDALMAIRGRRRKKVKRATN
jgi:hypothetical protein